MSEVGSEAVANGAERKDRDERGRFSQGNAAAKGRPERVNKESYLNVLRDKLTEEKWGEVIDFAIADATDKTNSWNRKQGREFLAKYVLPQKLEVEIDTEAIIEALTNGRISALNNSGGAIGIPGAH